MKRFTAARLLSRSGLLQPRVGKWRRRAIVFLLTLLLVWGWQGVERRSGWAQLATPSSLAQSNRLPADEQALAEADRLNQQVVQLLNQGRYAEAMPIAQRSLEIRERILGANHPAVATSLNNLAAAYQNQGNYAQAELLLQRALSIREAVLGADHPDVGINLNNLAELYRIQGNYAQAEPLFQRTIAIFEAAFGANHPYVATGLNNLALLHHDQGNYAQAVPLFQRALAIREAALGANHPDVATDLNNLAATYYVQGNYTQAEQLYQRSLAVLEAVLGADHPNVAYILNNLAELYRTQGSYAQAEPLYQRALAIRDATLGADHPDVAISLNNLALLYQVQGNYLQAEPLLQRSLAILEAVFGADHPDVAQSLNNLASLYHDQGSYAQAEPLYQRSLAVLEAVLGADHPDVAQSLNNLAELYRTQGGYAQAEPLYQRSLAIREAAFGANHPDVAQSLNNLAELYRTQGNYAQAEPLYQRSLSIFEAALAPDHPFLATILNNLAALHQTQGSYAQAEPLYQRSLAIREAALGELHPDVANSLTNLAALSQAQGNSARAVEWLRRGVEVEETNLALTLSVGSEPRKRAYLALLNGTTNAAISLHLQAEPPNPQAADLALTTLLRRKGRVLSALTDERARLRQNLTPADQQVLDQLQAVQSRLSTLITGDLSRGSPQQYQAQLAQLQAQAEQLETQLAQRSAEFRAETQPVTAAAVQALLPDDAALVELVQYEPLNPTASGADRWGAPRYAAYVLHKTGRPQAVDLGAAAAIDSLVEQFRQALRTPTRPVHTVARQLDEKLMQPVRSLLGDSTHLLISPDSQLNLIPFAALVDETDRYLVDRYTLTYLTSGRDLLKLQAPIASRQPPVVFANPDYDTPSSPEATQIATQRPRPPQSQQRSSDRSVDLANLRFGALAGTQLEAEAIAPLLPNVTVLTQQQATEAALKQLQSPSILHIATHGFFLQDLDCAPFTDTRSGSATSGGVVLVPLSDRPAECRPTPSNTENPLLRSGLALAGFNARQSGGEDGVLTALEAAGLNLTGTRLVVLSACETGLGDVANGEGVYGLRRAFVMAGAESQLMSLWKVDDYGTSELMSRYYDRLLRGEGRSEALRQVQRELLQAPAYQHPYYWASFIFSGNWRAIDRV